MHGGITIPRYLATIAFRLPPHDEIQVGSGFVIPPVSETLRIDSERMEGDATFLQPIATAQKETAEEFVVSTVETSFAIAEEGFPVVMTQVNPEASTQEVQMLQEVGQRLQQGEPQGAIVPQGGQDLHLGLYL